MPLRGSSDVHLWPDQSSYRDLLVSLNYRLLHDSVHFKHYMPCYKLQGLCSRPNQTARHSVHTGIQRREDSLKGKEDLQDKKKYVLILEVFLEGEWEEFLERECSAAVNDLARISSHRDRCGVCVCVLCVHAHVWCVCVCVWAKPSRT